MRKIKVLQIIPSFGVGGAEKLVLDYLTHFDKEKVEIKAISMYEDKGTIYDNIIKDNKLEVIYLDKKPSLDLSMVMKIDKIIKEYKPDVIHSHMHTIKYIIFSILRNKDVKMFHTIHNEPEKNAAGLDKFFNKIFFKFLNCTPIALTDESALKVNNYYNIKNTVVVNNAIDIEKYKDVKKNKEEIRTMLNIPYDSFVVGHVGRFMEQKNHEFIIDIFNNFQVVNKNSYLILVGDGELKDKIKKKVLKLGIGDNVKFLGIRKDIPEILKALDVFLMPSFHEGFSITLLEAQASGIRCVISDKIDKKSILSENTVSLSLDDSLDEWCRFIQDTDIKSNPSDTIFNFDIKTVVKTLEKLYIGSNGK